MGYVQGDEMVLNMNYYYILVYGIVMCWDNLLVLVDLLEDLVLKGQFIGVVVGMLFVINLVQVGLVKDMCGWDLFVDCCIEDLVGDMLVQVKLGELVVVVLWGFLVGLWVKVDFDLQFILFLKEILGLKMFYCIIMGVWLGEDEWKCQLNSLICCNQGEIDVLLCDVGVFILDDYGKGLKL